MGAAGGALTLLAAAVRGTERVRREYRKSGGGSWRDFGGVFGGQWKKRRGRRVRGRYKMSEGECMKVVHKKAMKFKCRTGTACASHCPHCSPNLIHLFSHSSSHSFKMLSIRCLHTTRVAA